MSPIRRRNKTKDRLNILNVIPPGRGGIESITRGIYEQFTEHFSDLFDVRNVSSEMHLGALWRNIIWSDVTIIHRGFIFRKIFPLLFLLSRHTKFIFAHHFVAKDKKKDPYHTLIYSRVSAFIVLSKAIMEQIKENWPVDANKVFVIYPGVDVGRFFSAESVRYDARKRYGISQSELVVGVVGRICEEKNQELIIKAVKKGGLGITVFIVGPVEDKKYLKRLEKLSYEYGVKSIVVPKYVEDTLGVYNAIDFLVITSKNEPFGIVGLEAMACSRPILVPDNAGISEIISDGYDSFLYKSNDENSLAETLERAIDMIQSGVSEKARRKVEMFYTSKIYASKLKDVTVSVAKDVHAV